jgi:tight adherence protein B
MTDGSAAVLWASLGLALVLLPRPAPALDRAEALAARGRLGARPAGAAWRGVPPGPVALLAALAVTAAVGALGGAVLALAAAIASGTAARLVLTALRRRAVLRARTDLLAAMRLLAAELEAGSQPAAAFVAAADLSPAHAAELRGAAERCAAGEDPAFTAAALAGLGHAWRVADGTGAPLAAVCERVAGDLAARVDQQQAVSVGVAGARSSAALLAGLPVVGLLLGTAMDAHPVDVLFASASGRLVCLAGVVLDAAGLLWTQWLTARAEGP